MSQKHRKGTRLQTNQDQHGMQAHLEHIEEYSIYPSTEFLQALNQIDPKLVNQVIDMAAQEMQHRQNLQNNQLAEIQRVNLAHIEFDKTTLALFQRGQWLGSVVTFGLMILSGTALYLGYPVVAGTAITAIIGILIVYVLRKAPSTSSGD